MMQLLAHPLQRAEQEDMEMEELKDITTQEDTLILLEDDDWNTGIKKDCNIIRVRGYYQRQFSKFYEFRLIMYMSC